MKDIVFREPGRKLGVENGEWGVMRGKGADKGRRTLRINSVSTDMLGGMGS